MAIFLFSSDLDCKDILGRRGEKEALTLGGFFCLFSTIHEVLMGNGFMYFFFIKPARF